MPIVIRSCRPEHHPSDAWHPRTEVQWGGWGIVIGREKDETGAEKETTRRTAFFEAFPPAEQDVSGFIRGEGATVAEAEAAALGKLRRELACAGHQWCRRGYTNGLGVCARCKGTRSHAFPEIVTLGRFSEPLSVHILESLLEAEDPKREAFFIARGEERLLGYSREQVLRMRRLGIEAPHRAPGEALHLHGRACRSAARAWAVNADPDAVIAALRHPAKGSIMSFLSRYSADTIRDSIAEVKTEAETNLQKGKSI